MYAFILECQVKAFRATSLKEKLFKRPLKWKMTDNMEQYRKDLINFLIGERNTKPKAFRGQQSVSVTRNLL